MVAIKIQSKEDIIAAYLQSFGFQRQQLPEIVNAVTTHLNFNSDNGDKLISLVDEILLKTARNIFPQAKLDAEQLLAEFKLCFLLCDGAKQCLKYGMRGFCLPKELITDMQKHYICNAPLYHYTQMKPQMIESFGSHKRKKK